MTLRVLYLLDWEFLAHSPLPKTNYVPKAYPENFANKLSYAFPFIMHAHVVINLKIK